MCKIGPWSFQLCAYFVVDATLVGVSLVTPMSIALKSYSPRIYGCEARQRYGLLLIRSDK